MPKITRTAGEIDAARCRAQRVSFAADDAGDGDEVAEAMYQVLQWVLGDSPTDPTVDLAEDLDSE